MRLLIPFSLCIAAYGQVHFAFPFPIASTGYANNAVDAASEKFACIFNATKAGDLARVRFPLGTVTTGGDVRVSFQDVDAATGNPDGTVDQYRVVAVADTDDAATKYSGIISADGTDGGAKRTVAIGDRFAVVIDVDTYTAQNMLFRGINVTSATLHPYLGQNYCLLYTGTWAKLTTTASAFAIEYADGSYDWNPTSTPFNVMSTWGFTSTNATQDEIALRFTVPVSTQVRCGYWAVDADAAATVRLYDGTTSLGAAAAADPDIRPGTADLLTMFCLPSTVTLTPGNTYRWAIEATTTTTVIVRYVEVPAQAVWDQFEGGQNVHWDARVDAGSWTATTTRRPVAGVFMFGLSGGSGGGGSTGFAISQ